MFDIEVVEGGNGDDVLTGRDQGPDVLRGARGNDRLLGLGGADELDGGAGENVLDGGSGGDRFRFGTVTYENRTAPVIVITDTQANDGEAGEGDLVDQVPKVVGGSGDYVMTAGSSQQCACAISRDHFVGGPGADRLTGAEAGDVLEGGPGADRLDGGNGIDMVSYAWEPLPVVADLDPAAGDDGADTDGDGDADEGDTIIAVEDLTGGAGADRLTGDASPNDLDGGPGADRLDGLDGDDFLAANDGVSDTLACGSGTFDFAIVDLQDVAPDFGDCERLNRAPLREHPMVEVSPQARQLRAGQLLRISLKCPAAAPRTCSGTLALRAAMRSGRPGAALARARYSIRRRSSRRIDLRLPRALGRRMVAARPGAYVATADERAVDGRGKRARVPLTSP